MKAFFNEPAIKEKYLARVRHHRELDHLVQGTGWENGKGCAVGCTLENYDHKAYETELGIPEWLAHLEDRIFERLGKTEAMLWPEKFLNAIPVGVNLEIIKIPFLIYIVEESLKIFDHRLFPEQKAAIDTVLLELNKKPIDLNTMRSAVDAAAAYADAAAAAYAAAYADAAAAAYAAADAAAAAYAAAAAAYAAAYAADAAAAAYAAAAAAAAAYADAAAAADAYSAYDAYATCTKRISEKLIELLEGATCQQP